MKKIFIVILMSALYIQLSAQCISVKVTNYTRVFSFDWGATYVENQNKSKNFSPRYSFTLDTRYTLAHGNVVSYGLELPITIGAVPFYKEDPKKMYVIPLYLNVNLGQDGAALDRSPVGIFIGGGYGYHYQFQKDPDTQTNIRTTEFWGTTLQAGIRFKIPNMRIINSLGNSIAITARGYTHFNPNKVQGNIYGVGILISLLGDTDNND